MTDSPNSTNASTLATRRIRLDVDVEVERDSPRITHRIHPLPLYPNRFTVYVQARDWEWVKQAKEIFDRDGSSLSVFLIDKLREYWRDHQPGNPQTPLEKFPLDIIQKGEVIQKEPRDPRWDRLWAMTDEQLMERQLRLLGRPGTYLERIEMSMILLHRRLNKGPSDTTVKYP